MDALQRFLRYVSFETTSSEESSTVPSTPGQKVLGAALVEEMRAMGIADAHMDSFGYVYGSIPATDLAAPRIGLIAHMDTSPDITAKHVRPRIVSNYDGGDIVLNAEQDIRLSPAEFPSLSACVGQDLVVTDGTTLLGADDKAGVAAILTAAERILASDKPHGAVKIAFTPDEEIGRGADHFDIPGFDADYAYTVDGGTEGEIEFENFNAAGAKFTVTGFNIHPGGAKDTMINAIAVASEIQSLLPEAESPRNTEGYEGFYHLTSMSGDVAHAESEYIIRDHDAEKFAAKEENLRRIEKAMNEKYGEGTVKLEIKEQYRNMAEKIRPCYHLIENAEEAARRAGIEPIVLPIRGGTDGARLSFMGLPCPNIGTGGYACHGPYEHITVEGMEKTMAMLKELVKIYAE